MTDLEDRIEHLEHVISEMLMLPEDNFGMPLTGLERRVFGILKKHAGSVVSRKQTYAALYWDDPIAYCNREMKIVDVVICHLRKKMRKHEAPLRIDTVWGVGYVLMED